MTSIRNTLLTSVASRVFAKADESGSTQGTDATADAPSPAATPIVPVTDEEKVKKIKAAMSDREVFPTLADALAKLEKAAGATENFYGLPVQVKGLKADGTVDESIYAGQRAALAYVGHKEKDKSGMKAVLIFPVPTLEQFLAFEQGKAFLDKVMVKEVGLVAFRQVRDSATVYDFTSGMERIPANADEYAAESRRGGIDTDAFDALWIGFKNALKSKKPEHYAALPAKKQFLDALRSKAYALETDETRAFEQGGWFEVYGKLLINAAANNKTEKGEPDPIDASAIQAWLDGRDTLVLEREGAKPKDYSKLGSAAEFDLGL